MNGIVLNRVRRVSLALLYIVYVRAFFCSTAAGFCVYVV